MKKFLFALSVLLVLLSCAVNAAPSLTVTVANYRITLGGHEMLLDDPLINVNGQTYIPLKVIRNFDHAYRWDGVTRTVVITENPPLIGGAR